MNYPTNLRHRKFELEFNYNEVINLYSKIDYRLVAALNAYSLFIPTGEGIIVATTKKLLNHINDIKMKEELEIFIEQEKEHSIVHNRLNDLILMNNSEYREKVNCFKNRFFKHVRELTLEEAAAVSSTIETMAIINSFYFLKNRITNHTFPLESNSILSFWNWHSLEELEHMDSFANAINHIVLDVQKRRRLKLKALAFYQCTFIPAILDLYLRYCQRYSEFLSKPFYYPNASLFFLKQLPFSTKTLVQYIYTDRLSEVIPEAREFFGHPFLKSSFIVEQTK